MDAYKAIVSKRDTRAFFEKPVPEEVPALLIVHGEIIVE